MLGEQVDVLRRVLEERLGPAVETRRAGVPWLRVVTGGVALAAVVLSLLTTLVPSAAPFERAPSAEAVSKESPQRLEFRGASYERVGGTVDYPEDVAGYEFTPGGGLILVKIVHAGAGAPPELWVVDHNSVVRRYELASPG